MSNTQFVTSVTVETTPAGPIRHYRVGHPESGGWIGIRSDRRRRNVDENGQVVRSWCGLPMRVARTDARVFRDLTAHLARELGLDS